MSCNLTSLSGNTALVLIYQIDGLVKSIQKPGEMVTRKKRMYETRPKQTAEDTPPVLQ